MIKRTVKQALRMLGLRERHDWGDVRTFIPLKETLKRARVAGLSVGDYIDGVMNGMPGMTQQTIEKLRELGVFEKVATALEIGPGSGRYLEKVQKLCPHATYEIYETSSEWLKYLAEHYPVVSRPVTGLMEATASNSIDLAQAYKVFNTIPFIATVRY